MSPGMTKRRSSSLFGLGCGCKDSVSVSASDTTSDKSTATPRRVREPSSVDTLTQTSPSSSSCWDEDEEEEEEEKNKKKPDSSGNTSSFSGLLRELNDLERNVMAWGRNTPPPPPPHHRRSCSEGGRRIEESVAVVKESADPLGDFRRSMLQMIVENEIVEGEELRELLLRFLSLNSPCHHDLILRAFAEIWEEVFSGYEDTPDLLRRTYSGFSRPRHF